MMKLNCPNCKRRRKFSIIEDVKYQCEFCNKTFRQCISKECGNLVSNVPVCKECTGNGIKNGGSAAIAGTALLAVGAFALKGIIKR